MSPLVLFCYPSLFRGHVHGFRCTRHVSPQRLFDATSPSLRGVPSVWFPRFVGTPGGSDSLPLVSPHFVAFVWRYRRLVLFSSPLAREESRGSTWSFGCRYSRRQSTTETIGSLRFPSDPHVPTPCSRTPVGPTTPGHCGGSTRPPLVATTKAPAKRVFRGSIARHWDSLSTLRREGHPSATQDSLPAAGQALPGGICSTRRVAMKGFRVRGHFPPFSSLPDAKTPTLGGRFRGEIGGGSQSKGGQLSVVSCQLQRTGAVDCFG